MRSDFFRSRRAREVSCSHLAGSICQGVRGGIEGWGKKDVWRGGGSDGSREKEGKSRGRESEGKREREREGEGRSVT